MTAISDVDLEGLSDVEATIAFTNPRDFTKAVEAFFDNAYDRDSVGDHTVLVTGYPRKWFSTSDDKSTLTPRSPKALYFEDSRILILTMCGQPHELAAGKFDRLLSAKLEAMGCPDDVAPLERATVALFGVSKEPDKSWGPAGDSPTSIYATCVLESAMSESSRALSRDARIWLEHEESRVTQVVTVKVSRRAEIIFAVWTRARDIAAHHPPRAVALQEIRVTLQEGRPVADGVLSLSFAEICGRQPRPGTAEGDFWFSARELEGVARSVWAAMGIVKKGQ